MPAFTDRIGYWDHYASGVSEETPEAAIKNAFGWTQYRGHGPGDELLGDPVTALELGSGRGDIVAALAMKGVEATGLDVSSTQCDQARRRWGQLAGAGFVQGEALDYLKCAGQRWDAIFSIWGALWFTDPDHLLPLIYDRLVPGGRLVFSQAPPVPGSYGIQGMYGNGFTGRRVWVYRWAYEPDMWAEILRSHGFGSIHARVESAPDPANVGTLIVEARSH